MIPFLLTTTVNGIAVPPKELIDKHLSSINITSKEVEDEFILDTNIEYHKKQLKVCKELNIQPSKCVIFGITDKNHKEFGGFDRGTDWKRVCISNLIGDMEDLHWNT